jgi:hypothetical protein
MIQLSYQSAFDPFHAVYRLLRLWPIMRRAPLSRDAVRILDFYLLFPFRIGDIRFKRAHMKYRRLTAAYAHTKPYGEQPEGRTILTRMEPMQSAALDTLAGSAMIDLEQLILGRVQVTDVPMPAELVERSSAANERHADLMEFLGVLASEYELLGPDGLKARTGLLEHRYDPV